MKDIKVLGSGCAKCTQLTENVKKAVESSQVEAEVGKVTELNDIMDYGVMVTPALVIDGEVKSSGKVLTVDEIKNYLNNTGVK